MIWKAYINRVNAFLVRKLSIVVNKINIILCITGNQATTDGVSVSQKAISLYSHVVVVAISQIDVPGSPVCSCYCSYQRPVSRRSVGLPNGDIRGKKMHGTMGEISIIDF